MSKLNLDQFQSITGLSDGATLNFIKQNASACSVDAQEGIQISTYAAGSKALLAALTAEQDTLIAVKSALIGERLLNIICAHVESVIREAIAAHTASRSTSVEE